MAREKCECSYGEDRDPRYHQTGICPHCDGLISYGADLLQLGPFIFSKSCLDILSAL